MNNQYLSIQSVVFDIEFYSKEQSHALQNKVSRIFHENLNASMESLLDKMIPNDVVIKKDRLVFDLGTLFYDQIESELHDRIMKVLEEEFFRHFSLEGPMLSYSDASYKRIATASNYLFLLENLLLYGTLPWPVITLSEITIQYLIQSLYDKNRENLKKLLKRLGVQLSVRKRLVYQTGVDDIDKIVEVIEPAEATFIAGYRKKIIDVQQEEQVITTDSTDFSKAISLFILTYLLVEKGSLFSRRDFIRSVLLQMAANFNVDYASLLNLLNISLVFETASASGNHSLAELIRDLHNEINLSPVDFVKNNKPVTARQDVLLKEKLSTIRYYLLSGSLPSWSPSYSKEEIGRYFIELMKAIPDSFRELLFSLNSDVGITDRILDIFTVAGRKELLHSLNPYGASFIQRYITLVQNLAANDFIPVQDNRNFESFLWKIVFAYALKNDQVTFNKLDFVRFNIKHIEQQFNITSSAMVTALAMATQQDGMNGMPYADHRLIFRSMLDEYEVDTGNSQIPVTSEQYESVSQLVEEMVNYPDSSNVSIMDLLFYFVRYGSIPWWGKQFLTNHPDVLLQSLFASSPADAILFLKKAGLHEISRQRLLLQFSVSLVMETLSSLPDGEIAIKAFSRMTSFISGRDEYKSADETYWQRFVLEHVWDNFIQGAYTTFNTVHFYNAALYNLGLLIHVDLTELVQLFISQAEKEISGSKIANEKIMALESFLRDDATYQITSEPSTENASATKWIRNWLEGKNFIIDEFIKPQPGVDRSRELLNIFDYYLNNNQLPASLGIFNNQQTNRLLKEIILVLYHENKGGLHEAFNKQQQVGMLARDRYLQFLQLIPEAYETLSFLKNIALFSASDDIINRDPAENYLKTAIHHLIQWGTLPSWAIQYFADEEEFFEKELSTLSVTDAVNFMQAASKNETTEKILLFQFPFRLIKKLIHLLPGGRSAMNYFEDILNSRSTWPFNKISETVLRILMLKAIWTVYSQSNYAQFEPATFYRIVFSNLLSITGITADNILTARNLISNEAAISMLAYGNTMEYLAEIIEGIDKSSGGENNELATIQTKPLLSVEKYAGLDRLVQQYIGNSTQSSVAERLQSVIKILDYYLTWNKMPDDLHITDNYAINNLLKDMLLLLYHESRDDLKSLFTKDIHSTRARMQMHDLFVASDGGDYKKVSQWLEEFIEEDAIKYLREFINHAIEIEDKALKPLMDLLISDTRRGARKEEMMVILRSPSFSRFISRQYDEELIQWLLINNAGLDNNALELITEVKNIILATGINVLEKNSLEILLREFNLLNFSSGSHSQTMRGYIKALLDFFSRFSNHKTGDIFAKLLDHTSSTRDNLPATKVTQLIRAEVLHRVNLEEQKQVVNKSIMEDDQKPIAQITDEQQRRINEELLQQQKLREELGKRAEKEIIFDEKNKLYVQNAGLVLLHPFLSTCFTRLNLMENGKFLSMESRARAVHLLQYITFGTTTNPEHGLVLNKILCGFPLLEPLPLEITMQSNEVDITTELLQVVIQRSVKLVNSSVEGFRASFLQRDGVLVEADESWNLRVEQKSYDVLLQFLPWAFGMIKTSWMDKPLIVEWI